MTTPSGTIGLSDVNTELGYSSTALISMNDAAVRTLAGAGGAGTQITMNQLRGKSNRVTVNLTIASDTANYDIYTNRGGSYDPGKTDIILTINSGVVVYSSSVGSAALTTGSSWTSGDAITIVNNGTILGKGGNGGGGGSGYSYSGPTAGGGGSSGGLALQATYACSVNNINRIAGGGGGGGGGGAVRNPEYPPIGAAGGGGGGGIGNGSGGGGGGGSSGPASSGGSGSLTSAGSGGGGRTDGPPNRGGSGGSGGSYGSSGSPGSPGSSPYSTSSGGSGGAAGAAVSGNSYITWIATGTRDGAIT